MARFSPWLRWGSLLSLFAFVCLIAVSQAGPPALSDDEKKAMLAKIEEAAAAQEALEKAAVEPEPEDDVSKTRAYQQLLQVATNSVGKLQSVEMRNAIHIGEVTVSYRGGGKPLSLGDDDICVIFIDGELANDWSGVTETGSFSFGVAQGDPPSAQSVQVLFLTAAHEIIAFSSSELPTLPGFHVTELLGFSPAVLGKVGFEGQDDQWTNEDVIIKKAEDQPVEPPLPAMSLAEAIPIIKTSQDHAFPNAHTGFTHPSCGMVGRGSRQRGGAPDADYRVDGAFGLSRTPECTSRNFRPKPDVTNNAKKLVSKLKGVNQKAFHSWCSAWADSTLHPLLSNCSGVFRARDVEDVSVLEMASGVGGASEVHWQDVMQEAWNAIPQRRVAGEPAFGTCALVAPSGILLKRNYGKVIDKQDTVIRIGAAPGPYADKNGDKGNNDKNGDKGNNDKKVDHSLSKFLGSRTDVRIVTHREVLCNCTGPQRCNALASAPAAAASGVLGFDGGDSRGVILWSGGDDIKSDSTNTDTDNGGDVPAASDDVDADMAAAEAAMAAAASGEGGIGDKSVGVSASTPVVNNGVLAGGCSSNGVKHISALSCVDKSHTVGRPEKDARWSAGVNPQIVQLARWMRSLDREIDPNPTLADISILVASLSCRKLSIFGFAKPSYKGEDAAPYFVKGASDAQGEWAATLEEAVSSLRPSPIVSMMAAAGLITWNT